MNNGEAVGYTIMALNDYFKDKEIEECQELIYDIICKVYHFFDRKTEEEAYDIGRIIRTSKSDEEIQERLIKYYENRHTYTVQVEKHHSKD
ncbi:MAG: hypothetical protein ACOC1K_06935 [Nanoarchaeota archaeon]